jgi:hypothetical protein
MPVPAGTSIVPWEREGMALGFALYHNSTVALLMVDMEAPDLYVEVEEIIYAFLIIQKEGLSANPVYFSPPYI